MAAMSTRAEKIAEARKMRARDGEPVSPALKAYLAAFDAHLRAGGDAERTVTRAVMVERLFEATGLRPRYSDQRSQGQMARREREAADDIDKLPPPG